MQMQYVHVGWDLGGTWEDAREGESGILCFTDPPFRLYSSLVKTSSCLFSAV